MGAHLNESLRSWYRSLQCDTVAGEMLRAAGRLRHDFYNNGMGNNTSVP